MKKLLTVLLLFSFLAAINAQNILSLDSCRALAIKNNKALQISQLKIKKAHYDQKAAFTKYLPSINATGGYMHFSDDISLLSQSQQNKLNNIGTSIGTSITPTLEGFVQQIAQINPILGALAQQFLQSGKLEEMAGALNQVGKDITDAFETDTRNTWAAAVVLTQPLYMGGKIMAYNKITKLSEDLAALQHDTEMQQVVLSTDEAYWMVVSLANKQKLADAYLKLVEQLNTDVEKMIAEGVATQADGLTVKVKLNEAEMTKNKVDNGLTLSRMLLNQLCGLDLDASVQLADEQQENLPIKEQHPNINMEESLNRRPELQSLEIAGKIYDQKVNIVRSEMLPTLALTGGYMTSNPSLLNGFENKFRGVWNVSVVLQVPILHWGENFYKVKSAKADAQIAKLQHAEVREKVELQINQSNFKTEEAEKRLVMALKNMDKAEENLRFANKGFKEGVIPTTNVMEAQTAWLSAQSEKIDAQIEVRLAQTYLQKAMGVLGK